MDKYIKDPARPALLRFCSLIFLPWAQNFILAVIIVNSIILGLQTSSSLAAKIGPLLHTLDLICLGIFVLELTMKIVVLHVRFFTSGWNVFDFVVVGVSLFPSTGALSILRALRIMRVLRLVTNLPRLRIIVESILYSLPSIGWISLLLLIVFYIFAVLTTTLFGKAFPEWFGSMGASFYTLFQVLTLESWSMGISRPVMELFPYAWLIFIPFILLTAFIVLNVFIGIIVNAMGEVASCGKIPKKESADKIKPDLASELAGLKQQLGKVEALVAQYEAALKTADNTEKKLNA